MRCLILAGGKGRRLGALGLCQPKALVEVGGKPLISHVMNHAAAHGVSEFLIATGHLGAQIGDALSANSGCAREIRVVDTGEATATGGRLKRLKTLLHAEEDVLIAYCDGLSNVDLTGLFSFHRAHGRLATVTAVHPPSAYGWLDLHGDSCVGFSEKPLLSDAWINAGYFVVNRRALDLIEDENTAWERAPISQLARMGELMAYRHDGYWTCVDTPKDIDRVELEIKAGLAPWLRTTE